MPSGLPVTAAPSLLKLDKDPSVSGTHAALLFVGSSWRLYDCGSTNGTWLGGRAPAKELLRRAAFLRARVPR